MKAGVRTRGITSPYLWIDQGKTKNRKRNEKMKKTIVVILAVLLCCCFSGCKSKEERELENLKAASVELSRAYENARREYDQVRRDFEAYDRAIERLNQAK